MSKMEEDSSVEASKLLNKFSSWREESQRRLVDIIHSYNKSINEGFNNLVKEVSDLQAKVSVIKNEVDDLPGEVYDFKDDLGQQNSNMPHITNLLGHGQGNQYHNTQRRIEPFLTTLNTEKIDVNEPLAREKIKALEGRFGNNIIILSKISDAEVHLRNGNNAHQTMWPQNQIPSNEEASFSNSISLEISTVDPYDDNVAADEEVTQDLVETNMGNELLTQNGRQEQGGKKFKCKQCPYASHHRGAFNKHVKAVHEKIAKIKNHVCELCGFACSRNYYLKKHKESVHKQGGKKFKCEQCPFTSISKANVKRHVEGVHEKKKNYVCEECGHATNQNGALKIHMAYVHKIGDKVQCDQCSLEVYSQWILNQHIKKVHIKSPKMPPTRSRRGKKKKEEEEEQPQQEAEEQPQEIKEQPQEVKDLTREVEEQAESNNVEMS